MRVDTTVCKFLRLLSIFLENWLLYRALVEKFIEAGTACRIELVKILDFWGQFTDECLFEQF